MLIKTNGFIIVTVEQPFPVKPRLVDQTWQVDVPAKFFDSVVGPLFKDTKGIVYILPEVKPMSTVFPVRPRAR